MRFGKDNDHEQRIAELEAAVRSLLSVMLNHHAIGYRYFTSGQGQFLKALERYAPESPNAYAARQIASKG